MARKNEMLYVRYYTVGNAAKQPELKPKKELEEQNIALVPVKRIPIPFDPIAVFGTLVALVMIVCVLTGFAQVNYVNRQVRDMEVYISGLRAENDILQAEYEHGYDLEEVRVAAATLGMIPRSEAQHITITVPERVEEPEPTWWEELVRDFRDLFA